MADDQNHSRQFHVTRRGILTGAAAGAGLLVAWWAWPREYDAPLEPGEGEYGFDAWLTVSEDGVVNIAVPQLEMGQGVTTLLPQIIAQEMGADWRQVAVVPVPPSGTQPNAVLAAKWAPLWSNVPQLITGGDSWLADRYAREEAFTATADGTAQAAYEASARAAGASARAMLAMAAAEQWDVAFEECVVSAGLVRHGDKEARFGELAAAAAQMEPPDPPPLRPNLPAESVRNVDPDAPIAVPRLDLPSKVDGGLMFAGDVRLSGMLHASIRHGPIGLPELTSFDEQAAAGMEGVVRIVKSKRWIACIAESWWQAERACEALAARFDGPGAVTSLALSEQLDEALASGEAQPIASRGDPASVAGPPTLTSNYAIGPAQHAGIETASASAHFVDGKLHLWLASQAPEIARRAAAKAIGLNVRDVVLYPVSAGGSFDARLEKMHAIEAAQIAHQMPEPVQLTWPRAEESKMVPPRAPAAITLSTKLSSGANRAPENWQMRIACPPTHWEFGARLFDNLTPEAAIAAGAGKSDPMACEGAMPPYDIAHIGVEHVPVKLALPTGRLRGNAYSYTSFAAESFIDEIAHALGQDPMLYRMTLLGDDPLLAAVLRKAAQLGEWDGGRMGTGQGIAAIRMQSDGGWEIPSTNSSTNSLGRSSGGSSNGEGEVQSSNGAGSGPSSGPGPGDTPAIGRIACVAKARLAEGGVRVASLHAVVDIGRIINLDLARQQIEGGLIFGLGLAAGCSANWENGLPKPSSLSGLNLPSLADAPEVTVDFIESGAPSFDPGELGVAAAPPAIANALFAATGERYRSLPFALSRARPAKEPPAIEPVDGETSEPRPDQPGAAATQSPDEVPQDPQTQDPQTQNSQTGAQTPPQTMEQT